MKKSAIYLGMAALTLLSTAGGTMVHAADVGTQTNGEIKLQAPTQGAITLDTTKLPANLNFGSTEIKYTADVDQIATADGAQKSAPTTTSIVVSDKRGGAVGWKLYLKQDKQFATGTGTNTDSKSLDGAQLTITTDKVTDNCGTAPDTGIINTSSTLTPGTDTNLLTAKKDQGEGDSTMNITKYDLKVPGKSHKESDTYKSSLTWTFSDTI